MSIVSAKCPNCGASIQLDNERKEGFCSYCGSKVEVQAAISLVRIDNANELENYLNLAEAAIDGRNGDEAYKYANKVLEIDSRNGKAWLMKMLALDYLGTLQDNKVSDIIIAGNNAIKFSADPDTEVRVYSFYLSKAATILQICISHISDTTNVKEMWDLNLQVNFSSASERTASF